MKITIEELEQKFEQNYDNFQAVDEILADFKANYNDIQGSNEDKSILLKDIENQRKFLKNTQKQNNNDDDWFFDYDFTNYNAKLVPIEDLNIDELTYPQFLRDIVIPNFFPLPFPEIQNSILATLCLFNSASLPPEGAHGKSEVLLPTIYIQGQSGSGKSEIAGLFQNHYPQKRRKSIKGSDTGGSLVEQLTNACHHSGTIDEGNVKVFPAIAILENFYFKNLNRWDSWSVQLLAANREMAMFQRKGKEPKDFVTYLLKVFTSVEPLQAVQQQHSELLRRTIRIFTKRDNPKYNSSIYNWEYCKTKYREIWHPKNVEKSYLEILQEVQTKNPDNSPINNNWYPASVMLIATGVFIGIWQSIEEAEEHIASYWELVNSQEDKRGKAYIELYKDAIRKYYIELQNEIDNGNNEYDAKRKASATHLKADTLLNYAKDLHGRFYPEKEMSDALHAFMESQGFVYSLNKLKQFNAFYDSSLV